jgi:hypothetical protein
MPADRHTELTPATVALDRCGVPYVRPDLEAFVDDVWPLAEDRPDVSRWAREYAEARCNLSAGAPAVSATPGWRAE